MIPVMRKVMVDDLCDEELKLVFIRLPLLDSIRARAVCRRWRDRISVDVHFCPSGSLSYCPLVFQRSDDEKHTWLGYHRNSHRWEPLPPLSGFPRIISLLPFAGSGRGLLGFKISTEFSGYIVGDPCTRKWDTLPRSLDCWGEAAMFMVADEEQKIFRVIAVRDAETQIYNSEYNTWTRVEQTPRSVSTQTVKHIKSKLCAVLCDGLLYSVGGYNGTDLIISFDVRTEEWTDEFIVIPDLPPPSVVQLVECTGSLFAVTEIASSKVITVWGLGIKSRQLSPVVEMPEEYHAVLLGKHANSNKLKCVGHTHQIYFWRHKSLNIVVFDLLMRTWGTLPQIDSPTSGAEVVVDVGFFEPILVPG